MAANVTAEAITDEVHKDLPSPSKMKPHPFMKEVTMTFSDLLVNR